MCASEKYFAADANFFTLKKTSFEVFENYETMSLNLIKPVRLLS